MLWAGGHNVSEVKGLPICFFHSTSLAPAFTDSRAELSVGCESQTPLMILVHIVNYIYMSSLC